MAGLFAIVFANRRVVDCRSEGQRKLFAEILFLSCLHTTPIPSRRTFGLRGIPRRRTVPIFRMRSEMTYRAFCHSTVSTALCQATDQNNRFSFNGSFRQRYPTKSLKGRFPGSGGRRQTQSQDPPSQDRRSTRFRTCAPSILRQLGQHRRRITRPLQ